MEHAFLGFVYLLSVFVQAGLVTIFLSPFIILAAIFAWHRCRPSR